MSASGEETTASLPNPDRGLGIATAIEAAGPDGEVGQWIGPYKLIAKLGEGGFGVVWLAERREPMVQRVALKLIKAGMDSKTVIARFEQERQALALMNHPNVARVFDGGVSEAGRAYFVMEYVQGSPITEFCNTHTYSVRQRLQLFISVCQAVQHAHLKGIIHRDIKPSNILVAFAEGGVVAKVIDFGVAKATRAGFTDKTIFTEFGRMIGTPEYMSPEQAEMGALDVDTRTDVYSLGVVLYELLTTALPFDSKELRSKAYGELQRILREVEPPTPSKKLTGLGRESAARIALTHQAKREAIVEQLRRELEWIPLMAMRKDRARRYETPGLLAEDIDCYLHGEPLRAGPESVWYRTMKYIGRHRGATAALVVIFVVVVLGVAGVLWEAHLTDVARVRAETTRDFVVHALKLGDPSQGGRIDTTVAEAIRSASQRLPPSLSGDDPATQADLRIAIAEILLNNGEASESLVNLTEALSALQGVHHGANHKDIAKVFKLMGEAQSVLGDEIEAEKHLRQSCDIYRQCGAGQSQPFADAQIELGTLLTDIDRAQEAQPILQSALQITRRLHSEDCDNTIDALNTIGENHRSLGRLEEAKTAFTEACETSCRLHPGDHPQTALCLNNLATILFELRDPKAGRTLENAIGMYRRMYPHGHPRSGRVLSNLGMVLLEAGNAKDGELLLREALAVQERVFGGGHADLARTLNNLGCLMLRSERYDEAKPILVRASDMNERLLGKRRLATASSLVNLACARMALAENAEARANLVEAIGIAEKAGPQGARVLPQFKLKLAELQLNTSDLDEAEKNAGQAAALSAGMHPEGDPITVDALCWCSRIQLEKRNAAAAEEYWKKAEAIARKLDPPSEAATTSVLNVRQAIDSRKQR